MSLPLPTCSPRGMTDVGVSCRQDGYNNGAGYPMYCQPGEVSAARRTPYTALLVPARSCCAAAVCAPVKVCTYLPGCALARVCTCPVNAPGKRQAWAIHLNCGIAHLRPTATVYLPFSPLKTTLLTHTHARTHC